MKLSYVALMRWRPGDKEPIMLGTGAELSDYSFFQRGSIREFMGFTSKTVVRRTQVGARQTVKAQAYMCHVIVRDSHLACAVFCDEEYPSRAAMSVAMQTIQEFEKSSTGAWKTTEVDTTDGQGLCEQALEKYKVRFSLGSSLCATWMINTLLYALVSSLPVFTPSWMYLWRWEGERVCAGSSERRQAYPCSK